MRSTNRKDDDGPYCLFVMVLQLLTNKTNT
jgi:hypothetical protein